MMRTLYNWTAKRAGARMTIYAREIDTRSGAPLGSLKDTRVTGVREIVGAAGTVIATDDSGVKYRLLA